MARLHLFEFEDQPWFPSRIRDYMTDYLQFASNTFDLHKGIVPIIKKGLAHSGGSRMVDLGSGGGGGLLRLAEHLRMEIPDLQILLTDLYPNVAAFQRTVELGGATFQFYSEPVDARHVPLHLEGLRTQFLSFHHFPAPEATEILSNAVSSGFPIAVFEVQKRDFAHFIKFMLSPIAVLLSTPFIRPLRVGRIIFTYLLPLVPLFTLWDGLISVLRTYSVPEMEQLIRQVPDSEKYHWEVGEIKSNTTTNLFLLGHPK